MMKLSKIILLLIVVFSIFSCVDKRDLSNNTVIAHISSNPDGLHPFNDNSANRTYIFNYTQQTLVKMDIEKFLRLEDSPFAGVGGGRNAFSKRLR